MNASGTNTSTVVSVEPMTAPVISFDAASTGSADLALLSATPPGVRWREMFSTTTTVSSMMRPTATARPPSDIRLSVSPLQ